MNLAVEAESRLEDALGKWAGSRTDGDVRIDAIRDLGGHSGETFAFECRDAGGSQELVVRLAPSRGGDRAVDEFMRQAPLLDALHARGVAVPAVVDFSADPQPFGRAYMVVEMLPGRPLVMGPDDGRNWMNAAEFGDAYRAAARELARINAVDIAGRDLKSWGDVRTPMDEIDIWLPTFDRAPETEWTGRGHALAGRLKDTFAGNWTPGMCHGDFQTNNVLFTNDGGSVAVGGVVDWEIAHFGATELDMAWFMMMNDAEAWDPVEQRGGIDLDELAAIYEEEGARTLSDLEWFRALACYRIAAIAGFKIGLHRKGHRPDAAWERASSSVPRLLDRAEQHLEQVS